MPLELSQRQQQVLSATINHYIATAEPVGSKVLVDEYNLQVSSATIRNIMGVLEKSGLLYQPHTSAGRVPSDFGYRIYVDQLISPIPDFARRVEKLLAQRLDPEKPDQWEKPGLEAILRSAAQLLSTLSGCVTLITMPPTLGNTIYVVKLVAIAPDQVMVIVILDSYETQSVVLQLPPGQSSETNEQVLQVLTNFLNHHLQGKTLAQLSVLDWQKLDAEFQSIAQEVQQLLTSLIPQTRLRKSGTFIVTGLAEVIQQPEFSQREQVQLLLQLLEAETEQLWSLIGAWDEEHTNINPGQRFGPLATRVRVTIGTEHPLLPLQSCALVSSVYRRGNCPMGTIGVLGPTRMPYARTMTLVETAADYLSTTLISEGTLGIS
ncbi:heat-inducible transcriptional repressor HrcA [Synechococcus sp. PCC 6312]|uniref:heat-inducible transcriptional repressor HrcA n=1 Tax=Synechococcus sp. (strain ATCC 27167 / PCC 6312) TaxID=195253 RepID=UPI00029EEA4C|nr:heat-inducible transcriptional repressor HrcA [Synechococcus sp. PCC 6312]AFY62420.1 heat-inducible transcription repressor HrcA [Synechococcus sp. PCC 6312]